jgi:Tol biopolymer transport system component
VPEEACEVVHACLAPDPEHRPRSAPVVAQQLRSINDRLSGSMQLVQQEEQRRRTRTWMMAGAAALGLALFVGYRYFDRPPSNPPLRVTEALVTSPTLENEARLSPDGKVFSFQSDRNGQSRVYVQSRSGGTARLLTLPEGNVLTHIWSPDGRRIACVILQDGAARLHIVSAFLAEPPPPSLLIQPTPDRESTRLVRWIGNTIYLEMAESVVPSLYQIDLATGALKNVIAGWPALEMRFQGFDVHPDGQRVVFSATENGHEDLWTATLAGTAVTRLTNDASLDRSALWMGSSPNIVFQSNRGGHFNLWQISSENRRLQPLTSSQARERPTDASPDGETVAFVQLADASHLWLLDPVSRKAEQFTSDALSDFWPTQSADGGVVAFQRSSPAPRLGFKFLDARILVSGWPRKPPDLDPQPGADGFFPRLSADGQWVAYQHSVDYPKQISLRVTNLRTGDTRSLADDRLLWSNYSTHPTDWAWTNVAWGRVASDLYFVMRDDNGASILRHRAGTAGSPEQLVRASGSPSSLRDLHVSVDGRKLGYLKYAGNSYELHGFDLVDKTDRLLLREAAGPTDVFFRGWTADGRLVVVRRGPRRSDGSSTIVITVVDAEGRARRLPALDDVFATTARLDSARRKLYVTRVVNGLHNLFSVSLDDGRARQISDNRLSLVTFCCTEVRPDGSIIYAQEEWRQDIYIMRPDK